MYARVLRLREALELHRSLRLSLKKCDFAPMPCSSPQNNRKGGGRFHDFFPLSSVCHSLLPSPVPCFHFLQVKNRKTLCPPPQRWPLSSQEAPHLGSGRGFSVCGNGLQLNFLLFGLLHCWLLHHLLFLFWAGSPGRSAGKKTQKWMFTGMIVDSADRNCFVGSKISPVSP